jgi:hypothetical protein
VNGPRNLVLALMFVILAVSLSTASDIYIAQNAAGGNTGADCADAHSLSFFNSGGNWGSAGPIGPGTTVHLCGTFNAPAGSSEYLVFHGSGASGNVVTLLFESGAVLTAPYWSGGVIDTAGNSYVVVDGGANGTIQATANGTNQANHQDGGECVISHEPGIANDVTVQNLTCANLYIDASLADNGGEDTYGIDLSNANNLVERNNTLHDMKWAIRVSYQIGSNFSNLTIANNNIYNMDHGVFTGASDSSGTASLSGVTISGNKLGSMTAWDNTANNNHHDWMHISSNDASMSYTDVYIENNYASGDVGYNANAGIYLAEQNGSLTGAAVNNVFVNTATNHCWANGFLLENDNAGAFLLANNTFISQVAHDACTNNGGTYPGDNGIVEDSSSNLTIENNILVSMKNDNFYSEGGSSLAGMDYNDEYNGGAWSWNGSGGMTLFTLWQSDCHCDAHSILTNPGLNSGSAPPYQLAGSSSVAYRTGTNLTAAYCGRIPALCTGAEGNARPSSGAWDIGAYQYSGSGSTPVPPTPPTGLTATVQ